MAKPMKLRDSFCLSAISLSRQRHVFGIGPLSSAEAPYGEFLILGERAGNDGKRARAGALSPSHHSPRATAFPSQLRQETFTVKAARKRPLRRREALANLQNFGFELHLRS